MPFSWGFVQPLPTVRHVVRPLACALEVSVFEHSDLSHDQVLGVLSCSSVHVRFVTKTCHTKVLCTNYLTLTTWHCPHTAVCHDPINTSPTNILCCLQHTTSVQQTETTVATRCATLVTPLRSAGCWQHPQGVVPQLESTTVATRRVTQFLAPTTPPTG